MMRVANLFACTRGAAAAEIALISPILIALAMGSVELGNYFMSSHVVQKGVRDGSRFAARLALGDLTDGGCVLNTTSDAETRVQRITRTGDPDGIETPRLAHWTSDDTVDVVVTCPSGGYSAAGVYSDFPSGSPVVTVTASVPYPAIFDFLPFSDALTINSESQAAVFGA